MTKKERQEKILEIIDRYEVETQDDLIKRLTDEGIAVTQATVSRDIRELRITKAHTADGRQKYVSPARADDTMLSEKYLRVMKEGVLSMDPAVNILVIHTVSGMAMPVAAAIDALHCPEVAGCIAGDDTVFVATHSVEETGILIRRLKDYQD